MGTVLFLSGGEYVGSSGTASGTIVNSGGILTNQESTSGRVVNAVVNSGGQIQVCFGTASGTVVNPGGEFFDNSSNTSTTLGSGGILILDGSITTTPTISSGGLVIAKPGSVVSGATVMSGGVVVLEAGATAVNTNFAGGLVASTGVVDFLSGQRGSYAASITDQTEVLNEVIIVLSAGTATRTLVADVSTLTVAAGGASTGTMLTDRAAETILGSANGTNVVSSATETVSAGGSTLNTVVSSGGKQTVLSNGLATSTTIGAAGQAVVSNGGTIVSAIVQSGGIASFAGTDIGTVVNSGGTEAAFFGVTSAAVVMSGGNLSASDTLISSTVSNGGSATIGFYANANGLTLLAGATEYVGLSFSPGTVTGTVFNSGATIDATAVAYNSGGSGTISNTGLLTVTETAGTFTQQLAGSYSQYKVVLASDGAAGTAITLADAACYCPGTRIAIPGGEAPIETLSIGDPTKTASGQIRPIKWIGRRSYAGRFLGAGSDMIPILFKAGSLDDGIPARDLYVSAMHAMLVDGVLMPACGLVNGATILRCTDMAQIEYLHIELESHDLLLAEGTPSETFIDCDNRAMFQNAAEFYALYPGAPRPDGPSAASAASPDRCSRRRASASPRAPPSPPATSRWERSRATSIGPTGMGSAAGSSTTRIATNR